jgi:hypothetical protein
MLANNQKVAWGVLAVLAVIALGAAVYFYAQLNQLRQNPQRVAQEEVKSLVTKVGKLIVLPEGEEPTVATVTDPNLLKDQPFFANAKTGDKVLIYTNARKAVLYNPEENKIIEVAPVSIGAAAAPAPAITPPATSPPAQ